MTLERLAELTAKEFDVTTGDLRSNSRARKVQRPRQAFMLLAYEQRFSLEQIGDFLGRNKSSVGRGIVSLRECMAQHTGVACDVDELRETVKGEAA